MAAWAHRISIAVFTCGRRARGRAGVLPRLLGALGLALIGAHTAAAGPTLLFEAANGRVLYAEDVDDQWHPASLTKIMTAYLTFEAIKAGKLKLDGNIPYSEAASLQPPSKIGLPIGSEISVDLALQALIIKSANDIAVALAEAIGGSEAGFVELMNTTARRLGMTRTRFINPHGLPAADQVTTARDLAKLSRAVVSAFPEHNHYWGLQEMRLGKIRIGTHNGVLKTMDGGDGLKTGFICDSGFNVVASATREGVRLMAVVLGENTAAERTVRAQGLLEHGYTTLGWKALFNRTTLDNLPASAEVKDVTSIRTSVMAIECGNRRRVARVAQARKRAIQRDKAQVAAAQPAGGGAAGSAGNGERAAAAKPKSSATKAASASASGAAASVPKAAVTSTSAPAPAAAAPKPASRPKLIEAQ